MASSITMGVTWGLGGAIVAGVMAISSRIDRPDLPFVVFALAALRLRPGLPPPSCTRPVASVALAEPAPVGAVPAGEGGSLIGRTETRRGRYPGESGPRPAPMGTGGDDGAAIPRRFEMP